VKQLTKKQIEEKRLFRIFEKSNDIFAINCEQRDPPHPDISIELDGKKIGCDITTLYKDNRPGKTGSAAKKNDSLQNLICRTVESWLNKNLNFPVILTPGFNNNLIKDKEVTQIVNYIIDYVKENAHLLDKKEFFSSIEADDKEFTYPVTSIGLAFLNTLKNSDVGRTGACFVPLLDFERIKKSIEKKEEKIKNYSEFYDEKWLLLCIEGDPMYSDFDYSKQGYAKLQTLFDKVFLLKASSKKLTILK
jgi:hypothetical protein